MCSGVGRRVAGPLLFALLLVFYSGAVGYNLANYFPVGGDEVLIMSASHKLATSGVLGSDLAAGLFDADRRFFLSLPVQNVLQAAIFTLAGTGIGQARLPSLAAGVAVITLTTWFALRSFGASVAALTALALVFWRSNLIGSEPRPPLLALAQSGRYDLVVMAFLWTTVVLLRACLVRPRRTTALLVGVSAGLATLTQFYGIAAAILTAAAYVMRWKRDIWREAAPRWSALGFLLVLAPYVVFIVLNLEAFEAQAALHGPRVRLFDPRFWLGNLLREASRYAAATQPSSFGFGGIGPIGPWMLFVGALPGIVPLITRSRGSGVERALPWLSLAVPLVVLAVAEQTKAVLYASLIVPSLCLSLACGLDAVIRGHVPGTRWPAVGRVSGIAAAVLVVVLMSEGFRGYLFAMRESRRVTPYLEVGQQLASLMPGDGAILGPWRWWWALGNRRYFAVNGFWWHSGRLSLNGDHLSFQEEIETKGAMYLVVCDDFRADMERTVPAYRLAAIRFMDACSSVVGLVDDVTYGRMEVRRFSCTAERSSDVPQ